LQVNPQLPPLHVAAAFAGAVQTLPHAPQLLTSDCSFTQAFPHRLKPGLQTNPHAPVAHVGLALAGAAQTLPQAPQLFRSVCSLTQAPLHSA
jgi:hypothetical protein